jgi:hypothetical protein
MENYLFENYSLDLIEFSTPKKHSDYFVSKIKYSKDNLYIQFPMMQIISFSEKDINIEFNKTNVNTYSSRCYDFLSKLDQFIVDKISSNVVEWFGKDIPIEVLKKMYNSFLKAPKTSESYVNMLISITKNSKFYDSKNREISLEDIKKGMYTESICQLKYLMFSKDTSFVVWELLSSKNYKKVNKVKQYGFIDDPDDSTPDLFDDFLNDSVNLIINDNKEFNTFF